MSKIRLKSCGNKISLDLVNDLKQQLASLRLSTKPSYLWEISVADCDQVLHVCNQLNIDLSRFNIVDINQTLFIVNIECLLKHLKYILSESFSAFIDVSPGLRCPQLLNCDQINGKKNLIKLLYCELELNSKVQKCKISLSDEMIDMCSICGAMLGYPVIYCNNNSQEGNCLSCEPLCAYTVRYSSQDHTSRDHPSQDDSLSPIYSFSLPEVYRKVFYSNINLWFNTINELCNKNLVLEEQFITLPYVLT